MKIQNKYCTLYSTVSVKNLSYDAIAKVSLDFWHFLWIEPIWALINMLKWFVLKIRFCGDIREISDSVQANTVWSQTLRRLTLCGVRLFLMNIYDKRADFSKNLKKSIVG